MRVGIFGGSFDPPHVGHLLIAQDARDALELDQLLIIPAATQPLKLGHSTAAAHRLTMARRCFEGVPRTVVDAVEMERGGLSFMVETVDTVQRRWPLASLHLLIGEDVVATLPQWRESERLLAMVRLVILARTTTSAEVSGRSAEFMQSYTALQNFVTLATRRVEVSSTEIRARVRDGRSIRGFVPDAVAAYIASAGLYVQDPNTEAVVERA